MKIFTEKIFANRLPMKTISVLFQLILNSNFWFAELFSWEFLCVVSASHLPTEGSLLVPTH